MQRGDRRLDGVFARAAQPQRPLDTHEAFLDLARVPEAPILVLQKHQIARGVDPREAPGVV